MRGQGGGKAGNGREWVVGTRGSPLAMAQAREFARRVEESSRAARVTLRTFETTGDRTAAQGASLAGPGVKGLFTRELEEALVSGAIDFAVHSLKDLPTTLPDHLELAGVLARADVRDVLVYRDEAWVRARGGPEEWSPGQRVMRGFQRGLRLKCLPRDVSVGTSSPRRAAWVRRWAPMAEVVPLRGNVGTRLGRMLVDASMDVVVLALAGIERLGWFVGPGGRLGRDPRCPEGSGEAVPEGLMGSVLGEDEMLPAPGQGALGIEVATRNVEARELARGLTHRNTLLSVTAEREFLRDLGEGCASPVSAWGRVIGHQVELVAAVESGGRWWTARRRRVAEDAAALGVELAREARRELGLGL